MCFISDPPPPPPPPRFKNLEEEEHLFTCGTKMKTYSQVLVRSEVLLKQQLVDFCDEIPVGRSALLLVSVM